MLAARCDVVGWQTSTSISVVRGGLVALEPRAAVFFFEAFVEKFGSRRLLEGSHRVSATLVESYTVLQQTQLVVCNLFKHVMVHI